MQPDDPGNRGATIQRLMVEKSGNPTGVGGGVTKSLAECVEI